MQPDPYTCELDPETATTLTVYLITDVENVEEVRDKVRSGEWECTVVQARLVAAPLQLAAAANRAALAARCDALRTHSLSAEILLNLSLSGNISRSLAAFGVGEQADSAPHLLLCFLSPPGAAHDRALAAVRGMRRPIAHLPQLTDWPALTKLYKLHNLNKDADLLDVMLTRMATKSFVSH